MEYVMEGGSPPAYAPGQIITQEQPLNMECTEIPIDASLEIKHLLIILSLIVITEQKRALDVAFYQRQKPFHLVS